MAHKHTRSHHKRMFPTWDRDEKVRDYSFGPKRHLRGWATLVDLERAEWIEQAGGPPVDFPSIVAHHYDNGVRIHN